MSHGCVVFDKNWNYIFLNKSARKLLKINNKNALGKNLFELSPYLKKTELYQKSKKISQSARLPDGQAARRTTFEYFLPAIGKCLKIAVYPFKEGTVCIFWDISDKKRTEDNLKFLSEAGKILGSSMDYQITLNTIAHLAISQIADWCLVEMLDGKEKLVRVAIEHRNPQVVKWAKRISQIVPPYMEASQGSPNVLRTGKSELYPIVTESMLKLSARNKFELRILKKVGFNSVIVVPLKIKDKTIGAITFVATTESGKSFDKIDLMMAEELAQRASLAIQNAKIYKGAQDELRERRRIEEELRASRDQLNVIFQNVADGITVQDGSGKLIYANKMASLIAGYSSTSEMIENPMAWMDRFELFDEEGNELEDKKFPGRRALEGEINPQEIIQYVDKITGEKKWSVVKARPVFNERGEVVLIINIIQDITQRFAQEQKKDEFVALASHELKTPVTTLKMYTQLLEKKSEKAGDLKNREIFFKMNKQVDRLTELIKDLLDISKIRLGRLEYKMEKFRMDQLIRETVDNIQLVSTTHRIFLNGIKKQKVVGDRERIGQVLINLINNAIKYSPKGNKVIVGSSKNGNKIIVSVQDFGMGIPQKSRRKIFERFFQAEGVNQTFPGLGLGLYISSQIIKRHHGGIWVKSEKGKGSTFSFSLPTA